MKAKRERVRQAQQTCSHCAGCGKALDADEPVWRRRTYYVWEQFGRLTQTVAPHCGHCKTDRKYLNPRRCEGCGRPVHQEVNRVKRSRAICCEQCEGKVHTQEARTRRAQARGVTRKCQVCAEYFEPTRSDSKFCTARCRQKAYRRRVTDNKMHDVATIDIRNGVTDNKSPAGRTIDSRNEAAP